MDIYQQEKAEKRTWSLAAGITSLCMALLISLFLAGCQPKRRAGAESPSVIYVDTTRVKLVHRADSSANALIEISKNSTTSVTTYETSVLKYDSIKVSLP